MVQYDLVLRGGHVIDPANERNGVMDVAVLGGKIAQVAPSVDATGAQKVVDVAGLYVTPGLIDIHVHVYPHRGPHGPTWQFSVIPDAHSFRAGVTTFVNIAAGSMGDAEQDPAEFDPRRAADVAAEYPDIVVGIKTAHYWTRDPWDDAHTPWASVDAAIEAGARADRPVMVDFWPRPPERPYPDLILEHLRPGDIHTHVFARQFPVINAEGRVEPYMREARARGVWFDLGH